MSKRVTRTQRVWIHVVAFALVAVGLRFHDRLPGVGGFLGGLGAALVAKALRDWWGRHPPNPDETER
jgi:hypothetical protein